MLTKIHDENITLEVHSTNLVPLDQSLKSTRLILYYWTNHTTCQAMKWLLLVIALGNGFIRSKAKTRVPELHFAPSNLSSERSNIDHARPCAVDELLPLSKDGIEGPAVEWAPHDMVEPRYNCSCPFYRARSGVEILHRSSCCLLHHRFRPTPFRFEPEPPFISTEQSIIDFGPITL